MQVSLDGFNSTGENDEQKWVTWDLEGIRPYVLNLFDESDTIIIGRKLAVDFIPFWTETEKEIGHPMHDFATRIVSAQKILFTKTIQESVWENTELAKGRLSDEINNLKNQEGKDIIVYGGSSFVSALISEGLIDEFHFFINPVALGNGVSAFSQLKNRQPLKLVKTHVCESGIIITHYNRI